MMSSFLTKSKVSPTHTTAVLCLAVLCLATFALAQPSAAADRKPERVLHLPAQIVGTIHIGHLEAGHSEPWFEGAPIAGCGDIRVPANAYVTFKNNEKFVNNPSSLNKLSPDSFDAIKFRFASLTDEDDGKANKAVQYLGRFDKLNSLTLDQSDVSDKGLTELKKFTNLEILKMEGTQVEGGCFKDLKNLDRLKILKASECGIKHENFAALGQIKNLEQLSLASTPISDADLQFITHLKKLKRLNLTGDYGLTDACIPSVIQCKSLKSLEIRGTRVTLAGIKQLRSLTLNRLQVPVRTYSKAEIALMRALFPNTLLEFDVIKDANFQDKRDAVEKVLAPITR